MRLWLLLPILGLLYLPGSGQEAPHFYNVDKEINLVGKVEEIVLEPRYENRAKFLILIVKNDEGRDFICEISPSWFFDKDFHKGEHLSIVGSWYVDHEGRSHLIARQLKFQGELMVLRDKNGFPSWRGGQSKAVPKRRRKRF